jgi:GntR family transcriptional regulator, transcriptional repressor for pyruvate dehydrogenase complex
MKKDLIDRREPRPSTVDTVIDTVKSLLINKKLKPGDVIPSEGELAAQLSISRGSIREAMKILSAFGVVDIRRGDGTYIATTGNQKLFDPLLFNLLVTASDIEELAELRVLVEVGIVRLIVKHADDEDLRELEEAYSQLERHSLDSHGDPELLFRCDLNFHNVMGRITRNPLVQNVYGFVIQLFAPTMRAGHGLEAHKKLLEALKNRDLGDAVRAVEEHDEIWRTLNLKDRS